jgi:hypothetical protein
MTLRALAIWALLIFFLVPVFALHLQIEKKIRPKQSAFRLLIYILSAFCFVFVYAFSIVWIVSHLFPHSMK